MSGREGTSPEAILESLRRIVPTEQIEVQEEKTSRGPGAFGVEPATLDELVDVVKWARANDGVVLTRHPRPSDGERLGSRPRVYLRGRRMKRVKDADLVSGTVTVQSGIPMRELERVLEERQVTTGFPTRPWRDASLGSVLAAALDAHWGPGFGRMESEVLALGVVLPDGTAAWSRIAPRRAVGPDFDRLFLGSRGRYGIIYEATLRVYPCTQRTVLCYSAKDLRAPLGAIAAAEQRGIRARAVEILTPTVDRAWGKRRVGLTEDRDVLLIVEPWGPETGLPIQAVDQHYASWVAPGDGDARGLERLAPPVGWNVHEGLLPPPRAWKSPVVGVPWAALSRLADELGTAVPPGMWIVRVTPQGAFLSLADGEDGPNTAAVRALVRAAERAGGGSWAPVRQALRGALDPAGVLNPS